MNCPECHYCQTKLRPMNHAPTCSLIDLESAKWHIKKQLEWEKHCSDRIHLFADYARKWEGKFRIVCHENNQLRKKLNAELRHGGSAPLPPVSGSHSND